MRSRIFSPVVLAALVASACGSGTPEKSARARAGLLEATLAARAIVARAEPLIGPGGATRFWSEGGRVRAERPGGKLTLTLPADASGATEIADRRSSVAAKFALANAERVPAAAVDGFLVFAGALPDADLLHRVDSRGTEDFLAFATRPTVEAAAWSVDVTRVFGLRQIGNVLELLDAGGAPRLRVLAPRVIDAGGARYRAKLVVLGCALDHDPRAPWGRPVTSPGASACTLRVDWSGLGVRYPALVDPHWVATNDMAAPRAAHTATLLTNGEVLIAGGGNDESSAELYDEGTDTFGATGAMTTPRAGHTATLLQDGKVLVASGAAGPLGFILSSEIYDPATGQFTASGDENEMHGGAPGILLGNGQVLVAGGHSHFGDTDAAELFDPATGQFSYTGTLTEPRAGNSATLLQDGTVLLAGGDIAILPGKLASAELYDPSTGTFSATGSLSDLRAGHTGTLLQDGRVLIAGGYDAPNLTTEIYDPTAKTFSLGPDLTSAQADHRAALLPDGTVLIAGGGDEVDFTKTAQLYDPVANTVTKTDSMLSPRAELTLTLLPSGNVLAAGGFDSGGAVMPLFSAERLVAGTAKTNGTACTAASECSSGFCVDGVCCETACDQQCEACNETGKAGSCEAVTGAPRAPRADCTGAGDTCGGQCDGTHRDACNFPAKTTSCGSSCGDGMLTTSHCDGNGSCAADAPTACPNGLGCADATSCATTAPTCDGAHTLQNGDGTSVDCSPYACAGSACNTTCQSNADCASGAACTAGQCATGGPKKSAASSEDSSGCALGRRPGRGSDGALLALALALLGWRRRRA